MTPLILPDGIFCACERNRWERRPGDGGTVICCRDCGTIAAIVSDGGAECDRCYLCQMSLEFDRAFMDHDHSHESCEGVGCPDCVRGLTHPGCNSGIGFLNDDPAVIRTVAENLLAVKEKE